MMEEIEEKILFDGYQPMPESILPDNINHSLVGSLPSGTEDCIADRSGAPVSERRSTDRRHSRKGTPLRGNGLMSARLSCDAPVKEASVKHKEGSYGKINKCISFPDMLDMVPFMAGTNDVPPVYMLYGVVVHLDTLNASFSGHYISYVKDMRGNWFRIDDTVVQPVETSQMMSEGAYILFYLRSSPCPARATCMQKTSSQQACSVAKQWPSRSQKQSRPKESRLNHQFVEHMPPSDHKWCMSFANYTSSGNLRTANGSRTPITNTRCQAKNEFSDAFYQL